MGPRIEAANLVDVVSNLTTGDGSKLTSLIQSGDLSSAFQLATAAIVAVDVPAQTQTEDQDDMTKKRIAVIALMRDDVTVSLVTSKRGLVVMLSREFKKTLGQIKHACE